MEIGANSGFLPKKTFCLNIKEPLVSVCIPAYGELTLIPTLENLLHCIPLPQVAVYVCFNSAVNSELAVVELNQKAYDELENWVAGHKPWFQVKLLLYDQLPSKKAGVGLARKLCMDEASKDQNGNASGILLALDADCTVEPNYFVSVRDFFTTNTSMVAASIYFEHPKPKDDILSEGILEYELHLRYLKNALKWCGYPWHFHTVGSSMAFRTLTYLKSGGMNTRQAGEDYYFLHKLMPLGFGEIITTTVYPEARYSIRVPFGTGRSMLAFGETGKITTYNFEIFKTLKPFFTGLHISHLKGNEPFSEIASPNLLAFLQDDGLEKACKDAIENTSTDTAAMARFMKWFSGFRIIRCMHALRESGFEDQDVSSQAEQLLSVLGLDMESSLLQQFRALDKK